MDNLYWAGGILFVVVLVLMPIYSFCAAKWGSGASANLKGLNLPEGSIRAMLALMSVGSFIIVLVLGHGVAEMEDNFDQVVTAFGTLTGAIIGFYFGNRGSTPPPSETHPTAGDKQA